MTNRFHFALLSNHITACQPWKVGSMFNNPCRSDNSSKRAAIQREVNNEFAPENRWRSFHRFDCARSQQNPFTQPIRIIERYAERRLKNASLMPTSPVMRVQTVIPQLPYLNDRIFSVWQYHRSISACGSARPIFNSPAFHFLKSSHIV
ncbi:MAG: hypothetical protein ACREBD_21705, partial [Blastocatellia bacterium]